MNGIGRSVLRGVLPYVVLRAIKEKQGIHGYGVIALLRKRHKVYFGASTIYPLLGSLEDLGYLRSEWKIEGNDSGKPRKLFYITNKGERALDLMHIEVRSLMEITVSS